MVRCSTLVVAGIAMMSVPAAAAGQESLLPGGASALRETFQDWQLNCQIEAGAPVCSVSQAQRQTEGNQLVLAVELRPAAGGAATGSLVMPFGLHLASGVALQIDERSRSGVLPYSTCLPIGCLVPVTFDATALDGLRAGTELKLLATAEDGGQEVTLNVSLLGLSAALDRARTLAEPR
jgi:invasion protein IalB